MDHLKAVLRVLRTVLPRDKGNIPGSGFASKQSFQSCARFSRRTKPISGKWVASKQSFGYSARFSRGTRAISYKWIAQGSPSSPAHGSPVGQGQYPGSGSPQSSPSGTPQGSPAGHKGNILVVGCRKVTLGTVPIRRPIRRISMELWKYSQTGKLRKFSISDKSSKF